MTAEARQQVDEDNRREYLKDCGVFKLAEIIDYSGRLVEFENNFEFVPERMVDFIIDNPTIYSNYYN